MLGIVYKTTNLLNGKIYIGQTIKDNPNYKGSGTFITRAIKKYGKENFIRETLIECETQEMLDEYEELFIGLYSALNPEIGYNILPGTHRKYGGTKKFKKGRIPKKESVEKTANALRGVKWSEERKAHLRKCKEGMCGPMKGKKHSEEAKKKMSKSVLARPKGWHYMIGKTYDDRRKKDMSEKMMGKLSGEKNPMYGKGLEKSPRARAVEAYNPITNQAIEGMRFDTCKQAAEFLKCDPTNITSTIRGTGRQKRAKGFYFRYVDPNFRNIEYKNKGVPQPRKILKKNKRFENKYKGLSDYYFNIENNFED